MTIQEQIGEYISGQPDAKRKDMQELHERILQLSPGCQLWFLDGKNDEGKVVSNPNIGYGFQTMKYTDGSTRDFYRIGLSGNTSGISVYIMGIDDKTFLPRTYGEQIGKATVTGYCIRFKKLADIHIDVLEAAICYGFEIS